MAVITPSQTASLTGVATLNQGFISNEIEDTYLSHLDLNGFCTIDNSLQGVAGDRRTIYKYTPSGTAVDVAEGAGNSASISVALTGNEYVVKCIQDWFQYSDEAMMRDPFAVQAGINHMGIALFNKVKYPYNVNQLTQQQALKMLDDLQHVELWRATLLSERAHLLPSVAELPICKAVYPTDANFFLARMSDADQIYRYLVDRGIIVRNRSRVQLCGNCLRITIGTPDENSTLLGALRQYR